MMVGAEGFEPPTLWSQTRCATRLRYAPTILVYRIGSRTASKRPEHAVGARAKHRVKEALEEPSQQKHRQ
jgi:hypothetical protein